MSTQPFFLHSFTTFGDLLKYLRRREHLTQLELSISVGYSEAQISRLEQNQRLPDLAALKAVFIPALHLENEPLLLSRFLELALAARQVDAPVPGLPPYKGLLFFDQQDADLFFGREALTTHLADRVTDLAMDSSSRFLAVIGASGSGKSSLVRAGLAVVLKRAGWDIHIFTPTASPLKTLAVNYNSSHARNGKNHLIVVDQFEETFTLCHDENERSAFIERLLTIARDKSAKTTIVSALRADFYSHCAQYPLLREAIAAEQEYIGPMTRKELRRTIEEPAKRGGWEFEPGLVDILLNDVGAHGVGEPGALPLLSHALLATWEHRRGRIFTLNSYHATGGVRGAIAETAESIFTDQLNRSQQNLARDIFVRLTELGEGTEDTRRPVALKELVLQTREAAEVHAVLNALAEARLITLNEDSAEVAHEALIREWDRLHEWLTQDREGLQLHRHLTDTAHEWEIRGSDASELYRGARLAQAREWASNNENRLNATERAFLAACIDQEERDAMEREAQRQRELEAAQKLAETKSRAAQQLRRRAIFLSGAFALAILLAGIALFFGYQANESAVTAQKNAISAQENAEESQTNAQQAEFQQRIATSRELAAASAANLDLDPELSILLALQAESTSDTKEAEEALHRAVMASHVRFTLNGHTQPINDVAYSPDGRKIATASQDKTAKIWDAETGKELLTLSGHIASVNGITFSPDGKYIATASGDLTAKIWDANTGRELLTLKGHFDSVDDLAFSPEGKRLATASPEGNARIWDIETGAQILNLRTGDFGAALAFSPDGTHIVTGGENRKIIVWDANTGKRLLEIPLNDPNSAVSGIVYSPDGTRIAAVVNFGAMVWDASTGKELLNFSGHQTKMVNVAFSPDGAMLATSSLDGKVIVWDATSGNRLLTLSGYVARVSSIRFRPIGFSPDGTHLISVGAGNTARIWDLGPGYELFGVSMPRFRYGGYTGFGYAAYSPDGSQIALGVGHDVKLLDATTGQELATFSGHTDQVTTTTFSPDGKRIAASSFDQTVIVWDVSSGENLVTFRGHNYPVVWIAFSPDGTRIASQALSPDTIRVWDSHTGQEFLKLGGLRYDLWKQVVYSPDGRYLATPGYSLMASIWDASTGKELFTLRGHTGESWSVAFSPDSQSLATGSFEGTIKIWDMNTGNELLSLKGHTSAINFVAFNADGTRIASASGDGTAKIWNAKTGQLLLTWFGNGNELSSAVFSPDGTRLAISDGNTMWVALLRLNDLIALAKSRVTRSLTTEECQQYLHAESCPTTP